MMILTVPSTAAVRARTRIVSKKVNRFLWVGRFLLSSLFSVLFWCHLGGEGGEKEAVECKAAEVGDGQGDQAENRLN